MERPSRSATVDRVLAHPADQRGVVDAKLVGDRAAGGALRVTEFAANHFRATDLASLGDLAGASREIDLLSRLAQRLRQPFYLWVASFMRAMLAQATGRLEEAAALAAQALEHGRHAQEPDAVVAFGIQLTQIRIEQGRPREVLASARASIEHAPAMPVWRCCLALLHAQLGDLQAARAQFEGLAAQDFADLPRDYVWLASASMLAEVCELLGDQRRAASLYQRLVPFATRNVTSGAAVVSMGPVAHSPGLLATVLGRWDQAVAHFEDSLASSGREGARVSTPAQASHAPARCSREPDPATLGRPKPSSTRSSPPPRNWGWRASPRCTGSCRSSSTRRAPSRSRSPRRHPIAKQQRAHPGRRARSRPHPEGGRRPPRHRRG